MLPRLRNPRGLLAPSPSSHFGARGGQAARQAIPDRRGVTLLELIVVLALLGLVLGVAAPSFILPERKRETALDGVIATARRAAVLRGEPVTLAVETEGRWRIEGSTRSSREPIATGTLADHVGALRVHVTPLGACVLEPFTDEPLPAWDAVNCAPARAADSAGGRP